MLTLFSALSDSALQCSTVLSNAFRMIYLSMHFETFFFFPLSLATVLLNTHVYLLKCISLGMEMQNISAGFVKFTTSLICGKYLRYRHRFNSAGRKKTYKLFKQIQTVYLSVMFVFNKLTDSVCFLSAFKSTDSFKDDLFF